VDVPVFDYEVLSSPLHLYTEPSIRPQPLSPPPMPAPAPPMPAPSPPVHLRTLATNELFTIHGDCSLKIYKVDVPDSGVMERMIRVYLVGSYWPLYFEPSALVYRVTSLASLVSLASSDAEDQKIPQPLPPGTGQFDTRDTVKPRSTMEHTTRRSWHLSELVRGFAAGILKADPWYTGYQVPPNYEKVLNRLAEALQRDCPGERSGEVVIASLAEIEEWFIRHAHMDDQFMAWNVDPFTKGPSVKFVTRDTPTQTRREFIDLDAITQGVITTLRDWRRQEDEWERKRNDPKPCIPGTEADHG